MQRNSDFNQLQASYLFAEIAERRSAVAAAHPGQRIISLGIGDTTQPIPAPIVAAMAEAVQELGRKETYTGYQSGYGRPDLRASIAHYFYHGKVDPDEVFISDGSKPDIGRLQLLFGRDITMAVQDPAYPAYVASALISGKGRIVYMPCLPENDFFPDLSVLPKVDVIYFCSPNNPTGTVPARDQLESLVHYAREHGCLIVFDSAYAAFIQDPTLCASLYEIDGAKEVVLETGSLSKFAGFTGVRLGWTVVPKALRFADGSPVINDWKQVMSTYFNGACNIAQAGALAALTPEGRKGAYELVAYYMENARLLREGLLRFGLECYGGEHTPYIWARTPGRGSWELFDEILNKSFVVTTPGVGFGSAGEGFLRFSGFGDRSDVKEALLRLEAVFTSA